MTPLKQQISLHIEPYTHPNQANRQSYAKVESKIPNKQAF